MEAFSELLVMVLGIVASFIMDLLRKVMPKLNALPSTVRSVVMLVIAALVTWIGGLLGVSLPADPGTWDANVINSILVALVGMGSHAIGKAINKDRLPSG